MMSLQKKIEEMLTISEIIEQNLCYSNVFMQNQWVKLYKIV